ncbi:MAG TPA: NAD-dependent epimerase/dehydratase family protein, partial [Planctomycetota bacterium]|nr:NAD-dependent epimerase/dehydratase family protein [Planctomycetota bacterium]
MILVTGGAGYIGRHICRALGKSEVVALDDLRNTSRMALPPEIPLIQEELSKAKFDWAGIEAVIHCAGSSDVAQSVRDPGLYWRNNLAAAATFFEGVRGKTVVVSSTAAVYGEPASLPISEDHLTVPTNPYGHTKLALEYLLKDYGARLTVLRYFNAGGEDEDHRVETHLIPNVVRAALSGMPMTVYGDGSNIRDFVHVDDLARAHVLALETPGTYNLGSGSGKTVLEVIEVARRVTGKRIDVVFEPARPGDPKSLVADISRARRSLGWSPTRTLEDMIASSLEWRKAHPQGYA